MHASADWLALEKPLLEDGGVYPSRIEIIENWAPLNEIVPRPRDNDWARDRGLVDKFVFLYSGTLGLKHNPSLLSQLAEEFSAEQAVRVVVVSQGLGRQFLEKEKSDKGLDNLVLLDFVPFETLSDVLGAADVLVTILEPEAGALSVPSKVLSYLCAGRPILAAIPQENLAGQTILHADAGIVVEPTSPEDFLCQAMRFHEDSSFGRKQGEHALAYSASHFDIERIGQRFLRLIKEGQV